MSADGGGDGLIDCRQSVGVLETGALTDGDGVGHGAGRQCCLYAGIYQKWVQRAKREYILHSYDNLMSRSWHGGRWGRTSNTVVTHSRSNCLVNGRNRLGDMETCAITNRDGFGDGASRQSCVNTDVD